MTPPRSHASADSYDPFEDTRGPVSQALHFEVERIPGAAPDEPARFRKTIKPGVGDELLRMIHRENMLLMDMAAHRLTHVAQSLEFSRSSSAVPFVVTTLDAGPSLNLWQRHHFTRLEEAAAPARSLLAPSAFARLLQQLLMALREFHAAGFVHCDIHAGNICLPFDRHPTTARAVRPLYEQLRLIDFGHTLSARLRLEAPLCLDPDAAESLRRVSPAFRAALRADSASGRPDEVGKLDFRLDLHALGALAAQWLGAVDWASEPQAVAQQPALASCVASLLAQDCDGTAPQPGLHERLLGPIDDIVRRLGVPPAEWLLPQRLSRQQAAASVAGAQEARETPLIVARPTPIALPAAGKADGHAATGTAVESGRAPGSAAAPGWAAAAATAPPSASASAAESPGAFGGGPSASAPTFTAASPAARAGKEAARPPTASRIPARSHLVLWSLVAAALAAGAWAVINLGGTDPQPATRTAARPPAPAKAVVAARPRPAVTNPLPDTLPAPAPGVPLSARQLEEHLDLMMNSAASGAWAEVEAVARRIATAAGAPPSEPSALVRAGQQAIESTDYETAAATLRNATEQTPDDWRAWSALGYASLRLDRLQEAKTALIRSLRLNPQDASAWAHLGEIFALQEQKRAAAKSLRLAVYYSTQRARTLAHLRQSEATSIQPQFKAVIKEEGAKLDRIPERAPS